MTAEPPMPSEASDASEGDPKPGDLDPRGPFTTGLSWHDDGQEGAPDPLEELRRTWNERDWIPGYVLTNVIGQGGEGLVLDARRISTGRRYAAKFLSPNLAAAKGEIEALAVLVRINDRTLVRIEDRGETDGIPWIVMHHGGDISLAQHLREGAPGHSLEKLIAWISDVAQALDTLHRHGMLHLDVKPANILIAAREAMLADLGLLRPLQEAPLAGLLRGTPGYMAPEVLAGERVRESADIFALGQVLAECLVPLADSEERTRLSALAQQALHPQPEQRPPITAFRRAPLERFTFGDTRRVSFRTVERVSHQERGPRFRNPS